MNERRLAGAVRTDDRVELSGRDRQADVVGDHEGAVSLAQVFEFQDRISHGGLAGASP